MGDLKNMVVGGENSFSNSNEYAGVTAGARKNTLYHHHHHPTQDIVQNTEFILDHFRKPLFPRTISTFRTKGKQFRVYSVNEMVCEFEKACYVDCKINAFPSNDSPTPDFIFIDIDKGDYVNTHTTLYKTLKNIKERLDNSNPTVLYTGNGYHIYQPIDGLRLESIQDFNFVENPSNKFLRFAKDFLSEGYADKCNNPSLKSCLARVPGSFNSKCLAKGLPLEKAQVKLLQKWDGNMPSILNLLGSFYAYLVSKKIDEEKRAKINNYSYHSHTQTKNRIEWIEKLLKTPLKDHRKFCLWRILIPYLKNIKKLDEEQITQILIEWLNGCNNYKKSDFNPHQKIKENLRNVKDYKPIGLEKLKQTNAELYVTIR
jgi:hypothetical protein